MRVLRNALIAMLAALVLAGIALIALMQTPSYKQARTQVQEKQAAAQAIADRNAYVQGTIAPYADGTVILPNIYIDGVAVGGMNYQDAIDTLMAAEEAKLLHTITVHLEDTDLTFTNALPNLESDASRVVYQALSIGREDLDAEALCAAVENAQANTTELELSTMATCDQNAIRSTVQTAADAAYVAPQPSSCSVNESDQTISVLKGTDGQELKVDTVVNAVIKAFANEDYSEQSYDYSAISCDDVDLQAVMDEYCYPAVSASYNKEDGTINEATPGFECDHTLEEAQEALDGLNAGETFTMHYTEAEPEITTADLNRRLFRDVLCSYGSVYTAIANRTNNLRLCCEALDGTIVMPGEVFSFNDTVGERTAEKGYRDATIYVDNSAEAQIGGGICQVASTMYYCCLYAELPVLEREPHMFKVSYVPKGMDTTIYWDLIDFKFKNNTDYPIKISAYLYGGYCYVKLIGTDIEDHVVKMESTAIDSSYLRYQVTRYVYDSTGSTLLYTDDIGISEYQAGG